MIGNLNKRLEVLKQELSTNVPFEVYSVLRQSVEELQRTGIASGLRVGDQAPDFTLKDALGEEINLYRAAAQGPVVLSFYRGGWCPFCNLQLRAYQEVLPDIRELGAKLIAVSPQSPDNALSQQEKEQLSFHVASDLDGRVADRFNVLFEVSDSLRSVLQGFGGNLAEYNRSDSWMLPVPATFVIDRSTTIRFSHVDPDFMRRLEPEVILQVLRTLC